VLIAERQRLDGTIFVGDNFSVSLALTWPVKVPVMHDLMNLMIKLRSVCFNLFEMC